MFPYYKPEVYYFYVNAQKFFSKLPTKVKIRNYFKQSLKLFQLLTLGPHNFRDSMNDVIFGKCLYGGANSILIT